MTRMQGGEWIKLCEVQMSDRLLPDERRHRRLILTVVFWEDVTKIHDKTV